MEALKTENQKEYKEFYGRIMEITLKDGTKEYYPQVKMKSSKSNDWMYLKMNIFPFPWNEYGLYYNECGAMCKTANEAKKKINKYEIEREEYHEKLRKQLDEYKLREESIKETNFINPNELPEVPDPTKITIIAQSSDSFLHRLASLWKF